MQINRLGRMYDGPQNVLEALEKDIRNNQNIFGGAMILLFDNFPQILPIIPQSTVADELNASLKRQTNTSIDN